jgi:hypothetical protein
MKRILLPSDFGGQVPNFQVNVFTKSILPYPNINTAGAGTSDLAVRLEM